jgi:hypothetical protein
MAHFAEINAEGIVQRVLVVSQEFIDTGKLGNPANWIKTSYNTVGGKYTKGETEELKLELKMTGTSADIAARNRKNHAGIGYTYDSKLDIFIPPQPFDSWKLNKDTAQWYAPKPYPTDGGRYLWNETLLDWEVIQ